MIIITTQCFSPKIGGIEALMTGMAESLGTAGKEVLVLKSVIARSQSKVEQVSENP